MWIHGLWKNQRKWDIYLSWKTTTKKLLDITIDEHFNFNEHLTNVCKGASRRLNALSRVSSFLSHQQKKVMSNSFICGEFNYCPLICMFSSIRSYRKINKLHERSLRLCHNDYTASYDQLLSKQDLVNIHVTNIQQLMIDIFKCLKGISPPIMNDIFRLRNIPCTIRNSRGLDCRSAWISTYHAHFQFFYDFIQSYTFLSRTVHSR